MTKPEPSLLILLRHGQSLWNQENRFTGWVDIDLSAQGMIEAKNAAQMLNKAGLRFDFAFTSVLKRAIRTLWIVQDEMDSMWIPVHQDWRLNERHFGALQGMNKLVAAKQYGEYQLNQWRWGYTERPPPLLNTYARNHVCDPRYAQLLPLQLPSTESLLDTELRMVACWYEYIMTLLRNRKSVLIVAHGNSIRALVKFLDNISENALAHIHISTGIPLIYELDEMLHPIRHYYLGEPEKILCQN